MSTASRSRGETDFDVFLSHNGKAKPAIRQLKQRLVAEQLNVWLDEDELRPGIPWQELLEAGIRASQSVVVAVGKDGLGPWEDQEMQGALRLAANDRRPVIPVLLPGCPEQPELPMFLGNRTWVDLRAGFEDAAGMENLLWGITGKKPKRHGHPAAKPATAVEHEPAEDSVEEEVEDEPEQEETGPDDSQSRPATLLEILPGTWHITIRMPFQPMPIGELQIQLFPTGQFQGQLNNAMGSTAVQGQWQANPVMNQIGLQGFQTNGFQTMPYAVLLQVNGFDPSHISGASGVGEQVEWNRVGLPPSLPFQTAAPAPPRRRSKRR